MRVSKWIAVHMVLLMTLARVNVAQSSEAGRKAFTLQEAIDFALKNYPSVRAALERKSAAESAIGLARTTYQPRETIFWVCCYRIPRFLLFLVPCYRPHQAKGLGVALRDYCFHGSRLILDVGTPK